MKCFLARGLTVKMLNSQKTMKARSSLDLNPIRVCKLPCKFEVVPLSAGLFRNISWRLKKKLMEVKG